MRWWGPAVGSHDLSCLPDRDIVRCGRCAVQLTGLEIQNFRGSWERQFGEKLSASDAFEALEGPCDHHAEFVIVD